MSKFKEELLKFKNAKDEVKRQEEKQKEAFLDHVLGELEKVKFEDFSKNGKIRIQIIDVTTKNIDLLNDSAFYHWLDKKVGEKFDMRCSCVPDLPFGVIMWFS